MMKCGRIRDSSDRTGALGYLVRAQSLRPSAFLYSISDLPSGKKQAGGAPARLGGTTPVGRSQAENASVHIIDPENDLQH